VFFLAPTDSGPITFELIEIVPSINLESPFFHYASNTPPAYPPLSPQLNCQESFCKFSWSQRALNFNTCRRSLSRVPADRETRQRRGAIRRSALMLRSVAT
jgi:hypothetical protein